MTVKDVMEQRPSLAVVPLREPRKKNLNETFLKLSS